MWFNQLNIPIKNFHHIWFNIVPSWMHSKNQPLANQVILQRNPVILLMEEILHQWIGSLSQYSKVFIPGFLPSTVTVKYSNKVCTTPCFKKPHLHCRIQNLIGTSHSTSNSKRDVRYHWDPHPIMLRFWKLGFLVKNLPFLGGEGGILNWPRLQVDIFCQRLQCPRIEHLAILQLEVQRHSENPHGCIKGTSCARGRGSTKPPPTTEPKYYSLSGSTFCCFKWS